MRDLAFLHQTEGHGALGMRNGMALAGCNGGSSSVFEVSLRLL